MHDHDVRTRLDRMIRERGTDYAALSRVLGRNPAYIQQFIKRGVPRRLPELDRRRLAAYFHVPEQDLGGPPEDAPAVIPPLEEVTASGEAPSYPSAYSAPYVAVPFLAVDASAGPGALPDGEAERSALLFERRTARQLASSAPDALSAITVTGDSMLPTLADGDQIVVDTADRVRLRDGIYVIRLDGVLLVKRLAVNPATRTLSIISDNTVYPSYENIAPAAVEVLGRVVWVGRRLG
jgi:phage repressor protein C with HTH and peptisase S24 domain